jgi:hypothetical protein
MTWHPTLENIEDAAREADWPGWQRNRRDNREPSPRWRVLGSGRTLGHDWPGKAQGAPHPRVAPDGLNPFPATTPPSETPCPDGAAHSRQAIRRPAARLSRRHHP